MHLFLYTFLFTIWFSQASAQLELTSGLAVNKAIAFGAPIHVGWDIKIKNKLFTKLQIGYKHLFHYNDFVGATVRVNSLELHQTISYEVVRKKGYIFKPNGGINFRFYDWKVKMKPPLNTAPIRAWVIGITDEKTIIVSSTPEQAEDNYKAAIPGFSLQLQNQFRITDKLWLHITPFLEPDYDRSQNTGGCYVGVILKQL